jgi:excisionase family DNA binding protein
MADALSYHAAATHLRVAARTVAKWIDAGRLKAAGPRNAWLVAVADLNEFCRTYGMPEYVGPTDPENEHNQ